MADKASGTAYGPIVIAAGEWWMPEGQRLVTDDLAAAMLPPVMGWMVRPSLLRRWLMAMTDREAPGLWNAIACRKRYLDDRTAEALADGVAAVVLLGAGFDTRGYRLVAPRGIPDFEVDMPVNIEAKRKRMPVPRHVTLVPIDFEAGDLSATLAAAGYRAADKTLFIWEGVTQYLTESAVRTTLGHLSGAAPGSRLGFTYVRKDFLDGTKDYDSPRTYRRFVAPDRLWRFGLNPADVGPLLAEYGWQETEQAGVREYTERYLEPAGRTGTVSDLERCVYAVKS
ncbi:SAM-dependent methyltransferase [Nocardia alni]|uniref:SAM-dependent methyltransferase n=1 Tax=Nocardia alni TaxID=2815723 RepID=UPI001C24F569|nr:SAM-dependent methyltransferase [Nocardia alni]